MKKDQGTTDDPTLGRITFPPNCQKTDLTLLEALREITGELKAMNLQLRKLTWATEGYPPGTFRG